VVSDSDDELNFTTAKSSSEALIELSVVEVVVVLAVVVG